jgi:hypothetical protein
MIADVRDVSDEVPQKEDKEGEEITSDLKDEEDGYKDEKDEDMADEGNYVTKDSFREMEVKIQNLEDAIADLKGDKESKMKDVEDQEMADDTQGTLKSRTVKEEFEAATKPIKHNPEAESKTKKKIEFAKGKFNSTAIERVLNKLNK